MTAAIKTWYNNDTFFYFIYFYFLSECLQRFKPVLVKTHPYDQQMAEKPTN